MSVKYLECILKSGLLYYVDRSEYAVLIDQMDISERKYPKGDTIFYEGDTIKRICIIEKGSVRSEKNYADGEVHILNVLTVVSFSIESLNKETFRKPVKNILIEMMADENIRMGHKIEILAERGLRDRVIVYLNILARRFQSNVVTVPLSREQLASYLCVNRSALSNELSKMRQDGIISFKGREFCLLTYNEDGTPK